MKSALDKNEYNHITATYFLLAERKLRAYRQEQAQKHRNELTLPITINAPNLLSPIQGTAIDISKDCLGTNPNFLMPSSACQLGALRTPNTDGKTVRNSLVHVSSDSIYLLLMFFCRLEDLENAVLCRKKTMTKTTLTVTICRVH